MPGFVVISIVLQELAPGPQAWVGRPGGEATEEMAVGQPVFSVGLQVEGPSASRLHPARFGSEVVAAEEPVQPRGPATECDGEGLHGDAVVDDGSACFCQ